MRKTSVKLLFVAAVFALLAACAGGGYNLNNYKTKAEAMRTGRAGL